MKCAFAACPESAGQSAELLGDGSIFYACEDHHVVIARISGQNTAHNLANQLQSRGVKLTEVGVVCSRPAEAEPAFVYFMRRSDGQIKIGFSKDVEKRRRQLESHFGPLDVLRIEDGGYAREQELHVLFKELRTEGEWFRAEEHLINYIAAAEMNQTQEELGDELSFD